MKKQPKPIGVDFQVESYDPLTGEYKIINRLSGQIRTVSAVEFRALFKERLESAAGERTKK